jgi:uncharacterized protein YndB with AHSA1/START domain
MAPQVKESKAVTSGKTSVVAEPGSLEIIVTRLFDCPRERLFNVLTDPALIPQWWFNTVVDKMEVRPGGIWRYVSNDGQGHDFVSQGVYHEIASPERLIYTFESAGAPGHVSLQTVTLEDQNGRTLMTQQSVFQSLADRDGIKAAMAAGANAGLNVLAKLVEQRD